MVFHLSYCPTVSFFVKNMSDRTSQLLYRGRRLGHFLPRRDLVVGVCRVGDRLAEISVSLGTVLLGQRTDKPTLKSVQRTDARDAGRALQLSSAPDDAVLVDQEHDDGAGVKSAGFPSAGHLALPSQLDKFVRKMTHLSHTQHDLQDKRGSDNQRQFEHLSFLRSVCLIALSQFPIRRYSARSSSEKLSAEAIFCSSSSSCATVMISSYTRMSRLSSDATCSGRPSRKITRIS